MLADDILMNVEYDALRIVFNKFHSMVSYIPTVSTILYPEVINLTSFDALKELHKFCESRILLALDAQAVEKESEAGGKTWRLGILLSSSFLV